MNKSKNNKKALREQLRYLHEVAHRIGRQSENWPEEVKSRIAQPLRDCIAFVINKGKFNQEDVDAIKIEVLYGVKS